MRSNPAIRDFHVLVVAVTLTIPCAFAQKVNVGYDQSIDFSRYKTYTLQEPATSPTRPLLYASVIGSIQEELHAKGLASAEKDGDLTLQTAGGFDYGLESNSNLLSDSCSNCQRPIRDVGLWSGYIPPSTSSGKPRPKGVLELTFVDRGTNKIIWSGTVEQKLDPDKKEKSLEKINQAIVRLLADFPPKAR